MDLPVTVEAPAKLTLSLRVTGIRDDGYHVVDAVMVSLDLADTLVVGPGDDLVVEAAATGLDVPASDDNLVRRALVAVPRFILQPRVSRQQRDRACSAAPSNDRSARPARS